MNRLVLRTLWMGMLAMLVAWNAWGAPGAPRGSSYHTDLGPMIGGVTADGATVWARLSGATSARVVYRIAGGWRDTSTEPVAAAAGSDYAIQFPLTGLQSATEYRYQVVIRQSDGHETWSDYFYFATQDRSPDSVTFSVVSDFMDNDVSSRALAAAATPRPAFLAVIGDMDHRNPAVDAATGQYYDLKDGKKVLARMRKMRRDMRSNMTPVGRDFVSAVMSSRSWESPQIPLYDIWDDHDYCGNNADGACPFASLSLQSYEEYFIPASDDGTSGACGQRGSWQKMALGGLATIFMLDSRMNRDEAGGTTMLGQCQKQWLLDGLQSASTVWKVVLSPVTLNPGTKTWDGWGHFPSERDEIVQFVRDNHIDNVLFISGDIHSGGAVDDGTHSGVPEVSTPHANMPADWVDTYCKIDRSTGTDTLVSQPGTWTIGGLVDPNIGTQPHHCLGNTYGASTPVGPLPPAPYPLAGSNNPGYASVQLTLRSATVRILDQDGRPRSGYRGDGSRANLELDLTAH